MAGHSKWHNIKHQKAAQDEKRSKTFQKLFREIVSACRNGGSNLDSNPRLAKAVENARLASMPKKNIESAIKVGSSSSDGAAVQVLEVTGPGGVALLVEAMGERKQLMPVIRKVLNHFEATLNNDGALSWMFDKRGVIEIARGDDGFKGDPEELAIEVGAENVRVQGDSFVLLCAPADVSRINAELKSRGLEPAFTSVDFIPTNLHKNITESQYDALETLIEKLEEVDDVSRVTTNLDLASVNES